MCALLPWIPPGGAAVSAAPTEQAVKKLPRNTPNTQNFLQRKDSHRWHGCAQIRRVWHPCNTHADKFCGFCEFCGRTAHHKYLCKSVKSVGEKIFPQNARNSQNLLLRKDSHRWHRCRRVWHPCHTHAAKFCGRTAHPKYLCKSVKSVGGHLSRRFCEFGVFCGIISHSRWRGYGKMPYPPKEKSVGGKRFPQNARNAQNLLQRRTSHRWHRWHRCSQM